MLSSGDWTKWYSARAWQVSGTICFQVQEATTPAGETWKLIPKVNRKIALHLVVKAAEFASSLLVLSCHIKIHPSAENIIAFLNLLVKKTTANAPLADSTSANSVPNGDVKLSVNLLGSNSSSYLDQPSASTPLFDLDYLQLLFLPLQQSQKLSYMSITFCGHTDKTPNV